MQDMRFGIHRKGKPGEA